MLVLLYSAGISFILLVGRPIPLAWIKRFVRVFLLFGSLFEYDTHREIDWDRTATSGAFGYMVCKETLLRTYQLYHIFQRQSIDTEMLLRISQVLKHDFFEYYQIEIRNLLHSADTDWFTCENNWRMCGILLYILR